MSPRNRKIYFGVVKCVGLTTIPQSVSGLFRQCGILNISQPYRPLRPVTGITLVCFCKQCRRHDGQRVMKASNTHNHTSPERTYPVLLILGVCILLRVCEIKMRVFPSTQRYYSRFYYLLLTNLLHVLVVRPSSERKYISENYPNATQQPQQPQ
jgi:hypothetical protein